MNYEKIYNQIIERAKLRQLKEYKERHHIIPKCLGGSNDKTNIVELTAREHYLCHMLLVEIYPNEVKLKYALWMMTIGRKRNLKCDYGIKVNSKTYERLRLESKKLMSNMLKGRIISDKHKKIISEYHKGKKRDEQWKQNMRHPKKNTTNMKHPKSEITKKLIGDKMRGKSWTVSEKALLNKRKHYKENKDRGRKISEKSSKKVNQYDLNGIFIKTFNSVTEANLILNKKSNASSIPLCCNGIYKQAFGYKWKYE